MEQFALTVEIKATKSMIALSEFSHLEEGDIVEAEARGEAAKTISYTEEDDRPYQDLEVADLYVEVDGVEVTEWLGNRNLAHIKSEIGRGL